MARPALLAAFFLLLQPPTALQNSQKNDVPHSNLSTAGSLLHTLINHRAAWVWASALAWAAFAREKQVAPHNAVFAVAYLVVPLIFCGSMMVSTKPERQGEGSFIFMMGLTGSGWLIPAMERYHYHTGSSIGRGYGNIQA